MSTAAYGYVQCATCHGEFHEGDVLDGVCWLCRDKPARLVEQAIADAAAEGLV